MIIRTARQRQEEGETLTRRKLSLFVVSFFFFFIQHRKTNTGGKREYVAHTSGFCSLSHGIYVVLALYDLGNVL